MRRGSAVAEPVDTRDADLARAAEDLAAVEDELDIANGRADREKKLRQQAQAALRDTAADVAAMHDAALPQLADLHPGFDEPMREPDGAWEDVTGDRREDYGTVEPVDFEPLYALIGARELAEVA